MTTDGFPLQYCRGISNIISNTIPIRSHEPTNYNRSKGWWYNGLMGTNSSYRKDALAKVNGYDEFFEYFLDETDLCLRLIQAGYEIHYSDVIVDHYPQPSHNRYDRKHLTCWFSIAKNTTYFALKHAFNQIPFPILCLRLILLLNYRCFLRIIRLKFTHNLSTRLIWQYIQESIEGIRLGWAAGINLYTTKI
jgi:GT2 family glycosyltransferase